MLKCRWGIKKNNAESSQINEHTPLPWFWNIDRPKKYDLSWLGNTENSKGVMSLYSGHISKDNMDFILTACNNFYKMKDMIELLCREIQITRKAHYCEEVDSWGVDKAEQLLKELDA